MRRLIISAILATTALYNSAFADLETLQNDGFVSGAAATFQAGFVAGEMAAARFVPQIACPCVVDSMTLLFGGANETRTLGLLVWEDAAGADSPGTLLYTGDVTLTGSNVVLQEIDLSLTPVIVNGPFRVGIEFAHNGLPSVATDLDGNIDAGANFILADFGGPRLWFPAATLGVSGDFIIRANINNLVEPDTDQDGIADEIDNCLLVANPDQRDTNGDGYGNLCDADINDDCIVNFLDLNAYRANFFQSGDLNTDNNGDGLTNFLDLNIVRSYFFAAPGPSGLMTICD